MKAASHHGRQFGQRSRFGQTTIRLLRRLTFLCSIVWSHAAFGQSSSTADLCFEAPNHIVYRTPSAIDADGRLDESVWQEAPWTADFVDMASGEKPADRPATRAKMLWDDEALYVAALLEEPHVWATLQQRDTLIYLDNAFEVFLDPDGDTHNYYELEINALGTVWDLMLVRPYRDGGPAFSAWDIQGLASGVDVNGTLNAATDTDESWTVELILPWDVLVEAAPEQRLPQADERWRVNFSRSHWEVEIVDGAYRKVDDVPAAWSVWSPQGVIDIHRPECWGFVQFAGAARQEQVVNLEPRANERIKWGLRRLYYLQAAYLEKHGRYADELADLGETAFEIDGSSFEPRLRTTQTGYEITSPGVNGITVHITQDGRVWTTSD